MPTLFIFVDGIGYAPPGPANPLAWPGLPRLQALAGHPFAGTETEPGLLHASADGRAAFGLLDANLDTPGLPQSGTGQAALFGGFNAARIEGRHVPAFPTVAIRERLSRENVFLDARARGERPVFLNGFRAAFFEGPRPRHAGPSCTVTSYAALGEPFRTAADLAAGRAVAFDITGEMFASGEAGAGGAGGAAGAGAAAGALRRSPAEAGRVAARVALESGFALFEYFLTDRAGHLGDPAFASSLLDTLDRFVTAAWRGLGRRGGTLFLTSDHGNLEDLTTRSHTRNPVPAVALGPGAAEALAGCRTIVDVRQALDRWSRQA